MRPKLGERISASLATKTILVVATLTIVVFTLISAVELLRERNSLLADEEQQANAALNTNIEPIAIATWNYDVNLLQLHAGILVRDGAIYRAQVLDDDKVLVDVTRPGPTPTTDKVLDIPLHTADKTQQIGKLRVWESYDAVRAHTRDRILRVLTSELVKILIIAIGVMLSVHSMITSPLARLAQAVKNLRVSDVADDIKLPRRWQGGNDEIDAVVEALNQFQRERGKEMLARTHAEGNLHERMREMEITLGALTDGVIAADRQMLISYANPAACSMLGVRKDEIVGRPVNECLILQSGSRDNDSDPSAALGRALKHGVPIRLRGDTMIRTRAGTQFDAEVNIAPASNAGELGLIVVFADISAKLEAERRILFKALHDPLTGLGNRTMLEQELNHQLDMGRAESTQVAVMFIDLDNFKHINDSLGHQIGDRLLKSLAQRLKDVVPEGCSIARHGGDEFVLVVPNFTKGSATDDSVGRIFASVSAPFDIDEHRLFTTPSIGISVFPQDGATTNELIQKADLAMYTAKHQGRNTYCYYVQQQKTLSDRRLTIDTALHTANANNEFHLLFQPKIQAGTGAISSVEALIRWNNPRLGMVSPAEFIPAAERNGRINEIGAWVLKQAATKALSWRDSLRRDISIAVNVSPMQFSSNKLMHALHEIIALHPDIPRLIELELTESALSDDIETAIARLSEINALGFRIALDDFGTGYSSLAYLKRLPLTTIKIDRAFIKDLHASAVDATIVESIVRLGKAFGFVIVAEGVEEQRHVDILESVGCDYLQGFLFSRPIDEKSILKMLGDRIPVAI